MTGLLSVIAMPFVLAAAGVAPAGCLELNKPDTMISGGTYACIIIDRKAAGSTLENLTVERSPNHGIEIYADNVTIRNVTVREAAVIGLLVSCLWRDGVCAYVPRGIVIEGGTYSANGNNGIKWDLCEGCVIRNARITHNAHSGIQINDVGAGPFLIENSEIDHNGVSLPSAQRGYAHGIYTGEPGRFYRNRVHDNSGYGIHIWPGPSPRTSRDKPLDIRYNRIYRNGSGGTVIGGERQGTAIYWHNTEYENGDSGLVP